MGARVDHAAEPDGSFESAPYKHDFKLSEDEKRKAKREALQP